MVFDLKESVFKNIIVSRANFGHSNLSGVKNIEDMEHWGPSIIDIQAIKSLPPNSTNFLTGCGLSNLFIEYLPSLIGGGIQFFSCFISYSSADIEFVNRLRVDLKDSSVSCWFAPEDMKIGEKIRRAIDEAIKIHDKVILVLSESSISSQWVEQEVEKALEKERQINKEVLIPVRLDDSIFKHDTGWASFLKNSRNVGDFSNWKNHDLYNTNFKKLLDAINKKGPISAEH